MKTRLFSKFRLAFCLLILTISCEVNGQTIARSIDYKADNSDLIVVGLVTNFLAGEINYQLENDADGKVYDFPYVFTTWFIQVTEVLEGEYGHEEIEVVSVGGEFNGLSWRTSKSFNLDIGQTVLLFLKWNHRNKMWLPYGQNTGVFVVNTSDGREVLEALGDPHVFLMETEIDEERVGALLGVETLGEVRARIKERE